MNNSSFSIWQWCLLSPDTHQQEIPAALTVPKITKTMAILSTIFTEYANFEDKQRNHKINALQDVTVCCLYYLRDFSFSRNHASEPCATFYFSTLFLGFPSLTKHQHLICCDSVWFCSPLNNKCSAISIETLNKVIIMILLVQDLYSFELFRATTETLVVSGSPLN